MVQESSPRDAKSATAAPATPHAGASYNIDQFTQNLSLLAKRSAEAVALMMEQWNANAEIAPNPTPLATLTSAAEAFNEILTKITADPNDWVVLSEAYCQNSLRLWANSFMRLMGEDIPPAFAPDPKDRRFQDVWWHQPNVFDWMKQQYFFTVDWLDRIIQRADDADPVLRHKAQFFMRQLVDALSPSNSPFTNPSVIRESLLTNGESLVRGMDYFLEDLRNSRSFLNIRTHDSSAFEVGKNLAITQGAVVFRNHLLELIQYTPTTAQVHQTPLFIVSPWINKYYILDLQPENSFVKWLTDQGYTVFITSWKNPTPDMADVGFEDYVQHGTLAALEAIRNITGEQETNVIGYCIGGTLMAATLSILHARKQQHLVKSINYLTTLVDFTDAGDMKVFIDEPQLAAMEQRMKERGTLDGADMAYVFRMLRANDLIWSFAVQHYLLGKQPLPFDLLYWNNDSTNMPAAMHGFYLRQMYLENNFVKPGGITLLGVPIDIRTITTPTYMLSTAEDHIAPWKSTYIGTQLYKTPIRFVLSASGHVAGVVNSPAKKKYGHRVIPSTGQLPKKIMAMNTQEQPKTKADYRYPTNPLEWLEKAEQRDYSWWLDYDQWLRDNDLNGTKISALTRLPGTAKGFPALAAAPGTYVLE